MTKRKKIDYINETYLRFKDARNHGYNGNSWWYPKPDTIAYNVKMHSFGDAKTLREYLTTRQNDYYSDEQLQDYIWTALTDEATMLSDDIDTTYSVKSGYAGRSGGWLEVTYSNTLEEVDENTPANEINSYYKTAQEMNELEAKVSERIKEAHKALNAYTDTAQYYKDIVAEHLFSDEDIAVCYKDEIKNLTDKLQ